MVCLDVQRNDDEKLMCPGNPFLFLQRKRHTVFFPRSECITALGTIFTHFCHQPFPLVYITEPESSFFGKSPWLFLHSHSWEYILIRVTFLEVVSPILVFYPISYIAWLLPSTLLSPRKKKVVVDEKWSWTSSYSRVVSCGQWCILTTYTHQLKNMSLYINQTNSHDLSFFLVTNSCYI